MVESGSCSVEREGPAGHKKISSLAGRKGIFLVAHWGNLLLLNYPFLLTRTEVLGSSHPSLRNGRKIGDHSERTDVYAVKSYQVKFLERGVIRGVQAPASEPKCTQGIQDPRRFGPRVRVCGRVKWEHVRST